MNYTEKFILTSRSEKPYDFNNQKGISYKLVGIFGGVPAEFKVSKDVYEDSKNIELMSTCDIAFTLSYSTFSKSIVGKITSIKG